MLTSVMKVVMMFLCWDDGLIKQTVTQCGGGRGVPLGSTLIFTLLSSPCGMGAGLSRTGAGLVSACVPQRSAPFSVFRAVR